MKRFVKKLGGSLYVILKPDIAEELGIKEGQEVAVKVKGKSILVTKIEKGDK